MGGYMKMKRSIWGDSDFVALNATAQRLYLLLCSQPDITPVGVIPLTPARWARLANNTQPVDICNDLDTLTGARFVLVDVSTEEVLVRSYLSHDESFRNPNGRKGLAGAYGKVHSLKLRAAIATQLAGHGVAPSGALTEAPPVAPWQGVAPLQQPATSNQHPTTSNQQPEAGGPQPADVVRAAISLHVQSEIERNRPANPAAYARTVLKRVEQHHGARLQEIAVQHPEMSAGGLLAAWLHPIASNATLTPVHHHDPNCALCDGLGFAPVGELSHPSMPDTRPRVVCGCEAVDATVIDINNRGNTATNRPETSSTTKEKTL